uniref:Methionine aminopeptidase n=1 Tax=Falco tinnunculus TaxID=100819 RepID=A0A8C4TY77_FALTI
MFGKTQTYGSLMQDPFRLLTAAGNKKPKWSLSGHASGVLFAWCCLVMGLAKERLLELGKGMALQNTPQNFMGKERTNHNQNALREAGPLTNYYTRKQCRVHTCILCPICTCMDVKLSLFERPGLGPSCKVYTLPVLKCRTGSICTLSVRSGGVSGSIYCNEQMDTLLPSPEDEKAKREVSSWTLEGDVNTNPWSGYRYTGKLRPHYPLTPTRPVPSYIQRPDYADHPLGMSESEQALKGTSQIKILSSEDIEGMRVVCRLAREVLDVAAMMVKAGVTTEEIDHAVHLACIARNCYPSPLNYYNFPKSCCTSVNEVICHGIPDRRPLQEGDIVNVDITVYRNGYHGDLNETFYVGEVDEGARRLVQTTYECLMQAIDAVKPGVRYRELGNIIQKHAQANGFSVVRSYCGHGIHKLFHTAPNVPHYAKNKAVGVMKPGHVFTIEPMICEGGWQDETWPDGWTAVTRDGKRSAQFEHTLLVTDTGCEILTRRLDSICPHFMSQ